MMRRLGFNCRWISWINICLKYVSVSILVNESPTKELRPIRGLRQGDPLDPSLFLIVSEGLAGLVREASRTGILERIIMGNKG